MKIKKYLIIFLPLVIGALVGLISVNDSVPSIIPSWIFPVVWSVLYLIMGYSSYKIYFINDFIPRIYYIQLIFNYLWTFIFFMFNKYLLSFIWIIILIVFVILMIKSFKRISKKYAYFNISYLVWLFIALYLNYLYL